MRKAAVSCKNVLDDPHQFFAGDIWDTVRAIVDLVMPGSRADVRVGSGQRVTGSSFEQASCALDAVKRVFGHKDPQNAHKTGRSEMLHDLYVPLRPFGVSGVIKPRERMNHVPCEKPPAPPRWLMFRLPGTVSKSFSLGVEKSQLAETFRTAPKRHV